MSARRGAAFTCLVIALAMIPGTAHSRDASAEDVAALAERATTDPNAVDRLREVTSIDGRPVDMGAVLGGDNSDVSRRLRTIADLVPDAERIDADAAASTAASILASREFQRGGAPATPGWLQRIGDWLANLVPDSVAGALGSRTLWIVILVAVALTALVLLVRARRRRDEPDAVHPDPRDPRRASDLEGEARRAAAAGDYSTAVRRWFEAGAIRMADRGLVPYEATATSGAIRRALPTATVTRLVATFDHVAYGRRAADRADAEEAERGWTEVAAVEPGRG